MPIRIALNCTQYGKRVSFEGAILRNLDIWGQLQLASVPEERGIDGNEQVTINGEKRQVRDLVDAVEDAMDMVYRAEVLG